MLRRLVVVMSMLLLGALGDWTSAPPCTGISCHDTCTVEDSCEPMVVQFNKECDDPYWDEIGLGSPQAEEICTQCCDELCQAVQTFPNCTGETCNQCYEGPGNLTENYDMHCCEIDGQRRCSLCTVPNDWNDDWTTELERYLPDGAVFSFEDDALCGDIPYEGECVTWDVDVSSTWDSCALTQDVECRGWYYSEKAPDCQRCIPKWSKVQLVSSSFERLTVQCKAGDAATCERVSSRIVDISVNCPIPDVCEMDINGMYAFASGIIMYGKQWQTAGGAWGVPDHIMKWNLVPFDTNQGSFDLEYTPPSRTVLEFSTPEKDARATFLYFDAPEFIDPGTGEIRDFEICQLYLIAHAKPGLSASVTIEDLELTIGENAPITLGTFSYNTSDSGPTIQNFCRTDYGTSFTFNGFIKIEGDLIEDEEEDRWVVQIACGTVPKTCELAPQ